MNFVHIATSLDRYIAELSMPATRSIDHLMSEKTDHCL